MKFVNVKDIAGDVHKFDSGGTADFRHIVKEDKLNARVVYVSPGLEVPGKDHNHDGHEMLYVISGDAQFHDGTKSTAFTPGDSVVLEPFDPHWIVAGEEGITLFELVWP